LRIAETKSILRKIARDCRNIALPPTSVIDARLIDQNEPRRHRQNRDDDYDYGVLATSVRFAENPRFASSLGGGQRRTKVRGVLHRLVRNGNPPPTLSLHRKGRGERMFARRDSGSR
jgi:hypothetical protein